MIPPGLFSGQTVAIIAGGPSATQETVDSVRGHRRVVINDAYMLAPDADVLFAHDLSWWQAHPAALQFAGLRVCGQQGDINALYLPMPDEIVTIAPAHILQVRNSGLMAIRFVAAGEAARILLCGFDPELESTKYPGVAAGLAALTVELRGRGLVVERVARIHGAPDRRHRRITEG